MRPGKAGSSKLPASHWMSWSLRFCSSGTRTAWRAALICSRVQRGETALGDGVVTVFPPVGLEEHPIDLLEIDDTGLVAHRFDERTEAEVACAAQEPFAGADDEGQCFGTKRVVTQAGAVELAEDEGFNGFGAQARQHD